MKKILILIHDMEIGGAQKSLLAFCQSFAASAMTENYEIQLMPIHPAGAFYEQIPQPIKVVQPPKALLWLGSSFGVSLLRNCFSWRALLGELVWLVRKSFHLFPKSLNVQQRLWTSWKWLIPQHREAYDVVISYMDGVPNYYAMDRVRANKKVLWVHNEYDKLGYDRNYDELYFENCDCLVTISEKCRACLTSAFPSCEKKVHILENISSADTIIAQSNAYAAPEFANWKGWKLLSVGRLNRQKGFDLAVEAANRLRQQGLAFLWLIVGEGEERSALQKQIEQYDLGDCVRLIGARENPYVYMRACNILVQPSRWEGKSVVLDEGKILSKPIVATNYATVKDSIEHGKTGWIVDLSAEAVAEGIQKMCQDQVLRDQLSDYLQMSPKGNEKELKKYEQIMF